MLTEQPKPKSVERGQLWVWTDGHAVHPGIAIDREVSSDGFVDVILGGVNLSQMVAERDLLSDPQWHYVGMLDSALMAANP